MLAGLGLGAGVAVGIVGAAIGLASARQEVERLRMRTVLCLAGTLCSCPIHSCRGRRRRRRR